MGRSMNIVKAQWQSSPKQTDKVAVQSKPCVCVCVCVCFSAVVKKGLLKGRKKRITLPKGGRVELLLKDAKNLTAVKGGSSDPFVKRSAPAHTHIDTHSVL